MSYSKRIRITFKRALHIGIIFEIRYSCHIGVAFHIRNILVSYFIFETYSYHIRNTIFVSYWYHISYSKHIGIIFHIRNRLVSYSKYDIRVTLVFQIHIRNINMFLICRDSQMTAQSCMLALLCICRALLCICRALLRSQHQHIFNRSRFVDDCTVLYVNDLFTSHVRHWLFCVFVGLFCVFVGLFCGVIGLFWVNDS